MPWSWTKLRRNQSLRAKPDLPVFKTHCVCTSKPRGPFRRGQWPGKQRPRRKHQAHAGADVPVAVFPSFITVFDAIVVAAVVLVVSPSVFGAVVVVVVAVVVGRNKN